MNASTPSHICVVLDLIRLATTSHLPSYLSLTHQILQRFNEVTVVWSVVAFSLICK